VTTTPEIASALKASVRDALGSLTNGFPETRINVTPDGQGGTWVEMLEVPLGARYVQGTTFVVCLLPFNLPGCDVYPLFVRSDLTRVDGQPLGGAFQQTQLSWPAESVPRPVVQVSRRTRGAFATQTASQKITKVLDWMRSL
jgi:hypothetical protein